MQKKVLIFFVMLLVAVLFLSYGYNVIAATGDTGLPGEDLTIQNVFAIINGLACWFARIASLLMVIFIIIAGLRFMVARGDPKAYEAA